MFNLNVLILKSLQGKNLYGLEIIKSISEQTDGEIVIKQPSLYSALRRFEARGFVSSYWQDSDIGGKRHYYTLTDAGQQFLDKVLNKKTKTEELANKINSPYFNSQEDELVGDAYMGNSSEFSYASNINNIENSEDTLFLDDEDKQNYIEKPIFYQEENNLESANNTENSSNYSANKPTFTSYNNQENYEGNSFYDEKQEKTIDINYKELLGDLLTDDEVSEENDTTPLFDYNNSPLSSPAEKRDGVNEQSKIKVNEAYLNQNVDNKNPYAEEIAEILRRRNTKTEQHTKTNTGLDYTVKLPSELHQAMQISKNNPIEEEKDDSLLQNDLKNQKIVVKRYAKWAEKDVPLNNTYLNINKVKFTRSIIFTLLMFVELLGFLLILMMNNFEFGIEQYIILGASAFVILVYFVSFLSIYRKFPDKKVSIEYKWHWNLFYRILSLIFIGVFLYAMMLLLNINATNMFEYNNILRWLLPAVLASNLLFGWFVNIILAKCKKYHS